MAQSLFKSISEGVKGFLEGASFDVFEKDSQATKVRESSRRAGEEIREKVGGTAVAVAEKIPQKTFNLFGDISRVAGGLVEDPKSFRPQPGDKTVGDVIKRQPFLFNVVKEKIRQTPIIGKVPGLAVVGGFLSEFLLPPYTLGGGAGKFADDLARATNKTKVKNILTGGLKDVTDKEANALASKLTKIDDVKVINQELQSFIKTKTEGPRPLLRQRKKEPLLVERGFIKSTKEVIPEADKISGQYIPRSTDKLSIKAKNLIKDDLVTAERIALTEANDNAVAIASELLKKYSDDAAKAIDPVQAAAFYDRAAEIANTLAPKLTEQGRSIQAASILGKLTPEGQVRFAAREIQRFNEINPNKKIPEITGEQSGFILKEMKEINNMPDGLERAIRFQKLQNFIKDLVPTPLFKKIIAVWKAGLLTGIKTTGLNFFSNLFHGVSEVAKDIPASLVDRASAIFTGKRTKTLNVRKAFSGIKDGTIKGKRYFVTGFDERNIAAKLDYKRVRFGKGRVAKAFQIYTDTVFRSLGSADQPFYYAALTRSLMDQALAQGKNAGLKGSKLSKFADDLVQSPTEKMIRYGTADATTAVFQNQTKLGEAARAIQKIPGVGEIVLPFGRTPSSVAMQIVNYSPVGILKTILENIGKGKFDQRAFAQGIGRGLTGTGVIAVGMELAKKGMVSLDYPIGDEREQKLQQVEGIKPNAILIGGKWRSPIVLGPLGNLLLIGAHFQKAIEEEGSPTGALTQAMLGSIKSFTEQTFLRGIQSAVNAISDPARYAKTYLPNLVASFVPTLVSDVARATDPQERRAETTIQRVQARVPGVRRKLEPQVDILGQPRERVGNPLEVLIDPTRPSPKKTTPVTEELRRLMDAGYKISPTAVGDRKGFKALSQRENTKLWRFTGLVVNDKLESLFQLEQYKRLADDQKGKAINSIVKQAKTNSRAAMAIELTEGLFGQALSDKLKELKIGGLLIRDVFSKYQELR